MIYWSLLSILQAAFYFAGVWFVRRRDRRRIRALIDVIKNKREPRQVLCIACLEQFADRRIEAEAVQEGVN